jgi:hypothetical protein
MGGYIRHPKLKSCLEPSTLIIEDIVSAKKKIHGIFE